MEKVKVKYKKTGAIKEVNKALVGDFVGTGNFVVYEEKEEKQPKSFVSEK